MTNISELAKGKSEGITFRIPAVSVLKLRQEADKKQVTLNTLVNQVLREFVEWHSSARLSDLTYLSKSLFSAILNEVSEERISQIAEDYVRSEYKDLVLLLKDDFSLNAVLELKENWARVSGMPYKYDHIATDINNTFVGSQNNDDNRNEGIITSHRFTLQHDMGPKYSLLLKEINRFLFGGMFNVKTSYEMTDNTIIITVEQP